MDIGEARGSDPLISPSAKLKASAGSPGRRRLAGCADAQNANRLSLPCHCQICLTGVTLFKAYGPDPRCVSFTSILSYRGSISTENVGCISACLAQLVKLKGSIMATILATVTTSAPKFPLGLPFPLPLATHHRLKIVTTPANVSRAQGAAMDVQSPLNKFMPGKSRREYLAGESIFSQGEMANSVFYIQSGNVKLTVVSNKAKRRSVAHLAAGSFLGEASIGGELRRASSANALASQHYHSY